MRMLSFPSKTFEAVVNGALIKMKSLKIVGNNIIIYLQVIISSIKKPELKMQEV